MKIYQPKDGENITHDLIWGKNREETREKRQERRDKKSCLCSLISALSSKTKYMLIAVGGVSRSGKTKLSKRIRRLFAADEVILLHQDDYVKPESEIPLIRDHIDWEVPASIDLSKWIQAVEEALINYKHVIVEGLFVYAFSELNTLYDKSFFVQISRETFVTRKREDLRWGKEPDWYIDYIWEAFLIHGQAPDEQEVYRLTGDRRLDIEELKAYLFS